MSEIERSLRAEDGPSIDHRVFLPSLIIVLIAGVYLVIAPGRAESEASVLMSLVTTNFGWLFLLVAMATLGFCGWLAFGRYGSVRLGDPEEQPVPRTLLGRNDVHRGHRHWFGELGVCRTGVLPHDAADGY